MNRQPANDQFRTTRITSEAWRCKLIAGVTLTIMFGCNCSSSNDEQGVHPSDKNSRSAEVFYWAHTSEVDGLALRSPHPAADRINEALAWLDGEWNTLEARGVAVHGTYSGRAEPRQCLWTTRNADDATQVRWARLHGDRTIFMDGDRKLVLSDDQRREYLRLIDGIERAVK